MPSAQGVFPRHRALSAVLGQGDPAARNLFIAAGAGLGGLMIGSLSVMSVVAAVSSSPSDVPIGSIVFDGPHVVRTAPAAASAFPGTSARTSVSDYQPAVAPLAQSVPTIEAQAANAEPNETFNEVWPEALSTKVRHRASAD